MSDPLHSERVRVDVGELLTDIEELGIDLALPVAPTASLIDGGRNVANTRDLSRYDQHLASNSSDDDEEEENNHRVDKGRNEDTIHDNALESIDHTDEGENEGVEEEDFSNAYVALDDDPDDQFSEFMSASASVEESTEMGTSAAPALYDAFTPASRVRSDIVAPDSASSEGIADNDITDVGVGEVGASATRDTAVAPAQPRIQPLTKGICTSAFVIQFTRLSQQYCYFLLVLDRIDIIRGTMAGLDFAKRPASGMFLLYFL